MLITIRRATTADAAGVATVFNSVIAERRYTAMDTPFTVADEETFIAGLGLRAALFVAEADGEIVGFQTVEPFAAYTRSMDHVGVMGTFVRKDWRGRGVGQALWAATADFARAHGYEKVLIYVRQNNEAALRYYRALGFRDIGVARRQVRIDGVYENEVFLEIFL